MSNRVRLRSSDRPAGRHRAVKVQESATATLEPDVATEEAAVAEAARPAPTAITIAEASTGTMTSSGGRRYRARIIEGDRWGSSGFYPRKVVERDGPKVFPSGTQMFMDHPTETEESDRPERSIRDLAATIVTTPLYEGDGLYATIEVFPHAQPLIESIGSAIGLSIRGGGTADFGTIAGRTGPIIESLTHGESVDFVTRAGAGGALISLAEAARANAKISEVAKRTLGAYLEAQLHLTFTAMADDMYGHGRLSRPERITLSSAIGDGLTAFTSKVQAEAPQLFERDIWDGPADDSGTATSESARLREATSNDVQAALDVAIRAAYGDDSDITQWLYVCDYDPDQSLVWYSVSDNQSRTTWQQAYSLTTGDAATVATLLGEPTQVVARTEYVPVPPTDDTAATATDTDVTESVSTDQAAIVPPTDVTDGAPPTVSTHPLEEAVMADSTTGSVPGAAGTTDTAVSTAVAEAQTARQAAETALDESNRRTLAAEGELARFRAVEAARPIITVLLGESQINTPSSQAAVMAQVTASVPLTEANVLDEAKLREAAATAITAKETELAEARQASGVGSISGLGAGSAAGSTAAEDAAFETQMAESFGRLGLSESAAKIAAGGRR